jgi:ribose-phosphate pyrophosphokinase
MWGPPTGCCAVPAVKRLVDSVIESVIVTNTVHVPKNKQDRKISTISVAPLFAEAIRRIHTGESVGALFD